MTAGPMIPPTVPGPPASRVRSRGLRELQRNLLAVGTLAAAVLGLFWYLGARRAIDLAFILRYLPSALGPAETSLELTTISFALGFFLALPLGILRAHPPRRPSGSAYALANRSPREREWWALWPFYGFASGYVAAVRGTPFLVQVFLVYYLVIFLDPRFYFLGLGAPFWAGLLALTINTTGYQAEALRGGFQSVDRAQVDAARAVGLTSWQVFWHVTFPQGLRLVMLPLANEWISNFKTSAILSYIAIYELFSWARTYVAYELARPLEAFVMIAIIYLCINVTLGRTVAWLEVRHRIRGLGSSGDVGATFAPTLSGR